MQLSALQSKEARERDRRLRAIVITIFLFITQHQKCVLFSVPGVEFEHTLASRMPPHSHSYYVHSMPFPQCNKFPALSLELYTSASMEHRASMAARTPAGLWCTSQATHHHSAHSQPAATSCALRRYPCAAPLSDSRTQRLS
jgi:hypothetical protein